MQKLTGEQMGRLSAREFKESKKTPVTIVLDNIRSFHNVGSVFRSADAFAAQKIILCGITPTPPHKDIHKTALGATETVDWEYAADTATLVGSLKKQGIKVYAVEQVVGSTALQDFRMEPDGHYALVFGNEVFGVEQGVVDLCDGTIEIPQAGTKHSLNISVCAGVVLWHFFSVLPVQGKRGHRPSD